MKTDCQIGFREKIEILKVIDKLAENEGIGRSSYIRKVLRRHLERLE